MWRSFRILFVEENTEDYQFDVKKRFWRSKIAVGSLLINLSGTKLTSRAKNLKKNLKLEQLLSNLLKIANFCAFSTFYQPLKLNLSQRRVLKQPANIELQLLNQSNSFYLQLYPNPNWFIKNFSNFDQNFFFWLTFPNNFKNLIFVIWKNFRLILLVYEEGLACDGRPFSLNLWMKKL